MTLPDRIRGAIASRHTAIEATPFALAMLHGRIGRADYALALGELHHLHAALEPALGHAAGACPEVASVYGPASMSRAGAIARDLAALGSDVAPAPCPAVTELIRRIGAWASNGPIALLGPLYVLEGSRMGSMALVRSLAPALGVERRPGAGLDYHLEGIATRPQDWQRFRATLAALSLPEDQQALVTGAAVATMQALVDLYAALPVGSPAPELAPA